MGALVLLWQVAQLVFWVAFMVAIVVGFAVVVFAPLYVGFSYLLRRSA